MNSNNEVKDLKIVQINNKDMKIVHISFLFKQEDTVIKKYVRSSLTAEMQICVVISEE